MKFSSLRTGIITEMLLSAKINCQLTYSGKGKNENEKSVRGLLLKFI